MTQTSPLLPHIRPRSRWSLSNYFFEHWILLVSRIF